MRESSTRRWYDDKIFELVPYLGDTGREYISMEPDGFVNFVQYSDADIVEVDDVSK